MTTTPPPKALLSPRWAFVAQLREGTALMPDTLHGHVEHIVSGQAALFTSYGQNIRPHMPTAGDAPYRRLHFGLSVAPLSPTLTGNMDDNSCGGRGYGLETPAGL